MHCLRLALSIDTGYPRTALHIWLTIERSTGSDIRYRPEAGNRGQVTAALIRCVPR
jgi:hypothetical protein